MRTAMHRSFPARRRPALTRGGLDAFLRANFRDQARARGIVAEHLGSGALPGFPIDGIATVRLEGPVKVENPFFSFMSLVIGGGIGYAIGKLT
jgi:hypothetical protein